MRDSIGYTEFALGKWSNLHRLNYFLIYDLSSTFRYRNNFTRFDVQQKKHQSRSWSNFFSDVCSQNYEIFEYESSPPSSPSFKARFVIQFIELTDLKLGEKFHLNFSLDYVIFGWWNCSKEKRRLSRYTCNDFTLIVCKLVVYQRISAILVEKIFIMIKKYLCLVKISRVSFVFFVRIPQIVIFR